MSEALEAFTTSRDLHPFALLYATATLQNFNAFTPLPKSDQVLSVKNFRGHRKLSEREVICKLYCIEYATKSTHLCDFGHLKSYPNTNQFLVERGAFFSWDVNTCILYWFVLNGPNSTMTKQAANNIQNICFRLHDSDLILEFNILGKNCTEPKVLTLFQRKLGSSSKFPCRQRTQSYTCTDLTS